MSLWSKVAKPTAIGWKASMTFSLLSSGGLPSCFKRNGSSEPGILPRQTKSLTVTCQNPLSFVSHTYSSGGTTHMSGIAH